MKTNLKFALPLLVATTLLAGTAHANCTLTVSAATLDMGHGFTSAMAMAEVPGYRQMGVRNLTVNGQCEVSQAAIRLRFTGLKPLPGKPLVEWGRDGALALRIERASVDGVQVSLLGAAPAATGQSAVQALDLVQDGIVELDLARLPTAERKSFSLQLRLTGLVDEHFAARVETRFNGDFVVQLVPAS